MEANTEAKEWMKPGSIVYSCESVQYGIRMFKSEIVSADSEKAELANGMTVKLEWLSDSLDGIKAKAIGEIQRIINSVSVVTEDNIKREYSKAPILFRGAHVRLEPNESEPNESEPNGSGEAHNESGKEVNK